METKTLRDTDPGSLAPWREDADQGARPALVSSWEEEVGMVSHLPVTL